MSSADPKPFISSADPKPFTRAETAEYIRDFTEELALMADGVKLGAVAEALQTAALLAQNAADRLGGARLRLRPKRQVQPVKRKA